MHNLAPRGIAGTCVPTSIAFATGVSYYDVEEVLLREQPKTYRPDIKGNGGVHSQKLLGQTRVLFGHRFTRVSFAELGRLEEITRLLSKGIYLVCVAHHMLVLKAGELYDLADTKLSERVYCVWKVEKV